MTATMSRFFRAKRRSGQWKSDMLRVVSFEAGPKPNIICASWPGPCILYTPAVWPACLESSPYYVHLPCFNTPVTHPMLSTRKLFYVNTAFRHKHIIHMEQYEHFTRVNTQQVTEADWSTRARDSRCAEAAKTQLPLFV
jgi:hypothetical protein